MSLVLHIAAGTARRTVSIDGDSLERVAVRAGTNGRLSAMEQEVLRRLAAEGVELVADARQKLALALLTYRGTRLELDLDAVMLSVPMVDDDLLQALRRPRVWLRYPAEPAKWLARIRAAAASLRYRTYEWRAGRGFEPALGGGDTTQPLDALKEAVARVAQFKEGPILLLFQDLDFREVDTLQPRAEERGAMRTLCEAASNHPAIHIAILTWDDDIHPQLSGEFEVIRLAPPARETPVLDRLGLDLTREARGGNLAPIIGGEHEVEQIVRVLNVISGQPNNVLLVGEPGVGKSALAEEVARRIAVGEVPVQLRGRRVVKIRANDLAADTGVAGKLEARVRDLIDEVQRNRDEIVLFIDEAHALFRQGGPDAPIVQALKEGWARGDLPTVAASTLAEVSVLESDAAVETRFRKITVPRPSGAQVLDIVRAFGPRLEQRHGLRIAPEAFACARDSAARYLGHEAPPRSALRILSAAASRAELQGHATLDPDHILAEVEEMTGIPTREPGGKERAELRDLDATLARTLHGQPEVIARIARLIRTRRLSPPRQLHPLVILAFGPSGTGKTEIGRLLQRYICDPTLPPILFPMEQTKQDFQITALLGAPPGYIGYDKGGELANRIAGRPHSVVIFDEIEKAHPDVLQGGLMQVLETGSYVDPRGRRGDYRAAIIVCTSNILGDGEADGATPADIRRLVVDAFSRRRDGRLPVPPEFVGRCQVLVPFRSLSEQACMEIVRDRIVEIQEALLADFGIRVDAAPRCAERLARSRWDPTQNARPIIDATRELEAVAREELELGTAAPTLTLDWDETGPVVRPGGGVL